MRLFAIFWDLMRFHSKQENWLMVNETFLISSDVWKRSGAHQKLLKNLPCNKHTNISSSNDENCWIIIHRSLIFLINLSKSKPNPKMKRVAISRIFGAGKPYIKKEILESLSNDLHTCKFSSVSGFDFTDFPRVLGEQKTLTGYQPNLFFSKI